MPMSVNLTPELEKFVHEKVDGGLYNSVSEVIREALRVYIEHDRTQGRRRDQLNKLIDEGLASAARGEFVDGKEAMAKLRRREEALRRRKQAA